MINFDVLLDDLGAFGLSQILIVLMLSYYQIAGGMNSLASVFIQHSPDSFRCNVPPLDNATLYPSLTEDQIVNLTSTGGGCSRYTYNVSACNEGNLENCMIINSTEKCLDGYSYVDEYFTETVVTEFDLVCEDSYLSSLLSSLYYVGLLIGSFFFGNFCDAYGRKTTMILCIFGTIGSMLGITFSTSMPMYMVFRILSAIFGYGSTIGTFTYLLEVVGREWRTAAGMIYQFFYSIGYMMQSGVAYQWKDWHNFMLACTIICSPLLVFVIILPESPRWQFVKGKEKQAKRTVKRMAKLNKTTISDGTWEKAVINEDERKKEADVETRTYTTLDLFRLPRTRLVTLNLCFNWFVESLVYYGVALNAGSLPGDLYVNNVLNGCVEIAGYIIIFLTMDRLGRRVLLSGSLFIAGLGLLISLIVLEFAGGDESLVNISKVFAFIGKGGISASFTIVYNVSGELYPTPTRSIALGTASMASRIGGILAPYVILLQDYVSWLPNTIFAVFGLTAGALSLMFPETMGCKMLETLDEAEQFYKTGKMPESEKESEINNAFESTEDIKL